MAAKSSESSEHYYEYFPRREKPGEPGNIRVFENRPEMSGEKSGNFEGKKRKVRESC